MPYSSNPEPGRYTWGLIRGEIEEREEKYREKKRSDRILKAESVEEIQPEVSKRGDERY